MSSHTQDRSTIQPPCVEQYTSGTTYAYMEASLDHLLNHCIRNTWFFCNISAQNYAQTVTKIKLQCTLTLKCTSV